jgi:hypothetical protein
MDGYSAAAVPQEMRIQSESDFDFWFFDFKTKQKIECQFGNHQVFLQETSFRQDT